MASGRAFDLYKISLQHLWETGVVHVYLIEKNKPVEQQLRDIGGHRQKCVKMNMIKRSEETQTLRAVCSKAEPKKIRSAADPLPGGVGQPKFNQLEMVTTFTYKPSLVRIDARNFELSW